jgi:hypothetical protein
MRLSLTAWIALLIAGIAVPVVVTAQPKDHTGFLKITDDQYKTGKGWNVGGKYIPDEDSRGIVVWDDGNRCDVMVVNSPHLIAKVWKVYANKDFTKMYVEESAAPAKNESLPRTKTELLKLDSFSTCTDADEASAETKP